MSWEELAASIEKHNRDIVESQTWGHLAPEPGELYYGCVTFACSPYGGIAVLEIKFSTKSGAVLEDNPWSFEDINDFIVQWICDQANGFRNRERIPEEDRVKTDGKIFRFFGTYTRFRNDNSRMIGEFEELEIYPTGRKTRMETTWNR